MEREHVEIGQRVRVSMTGAGDDGQIGTVKQLKGNRCYVHLDWDPRPSHVILLYADYLESLPSEMTSPLLPD